MTDENRDPQRGDFDDELAAVDPSDVQMHDGSTDAHIAIQVTVQGEDAIRLERIARTRGQHHGEVVAALLRDAETHAG